jgi:phage host-nuclease inhibitor protein Gam
VVELDITTTAVILGMAGIIATFYFNLSKQRRETKTARIQEIKEKKEEREREEKARKEEKEIFAQKVDTSINKGIDAVSERIEDKLEPIRISTASLEKRFDEYRIVNRDELLSIKQELRKLYEELDAVEKDGSTSSEQIQSIKNKIESLERRITDLEWKQSHPYEAHKSDIHADATSDIHDSGRRER